MIYTIKKDATMFKKYNKDAKQLSSEKTANMVFRNIKAVNYLANIHIYAHYEIKLLQIFLASMIFLWPCQRNLENITNV